MWAKISSVLKPRVTHEDPDPSSSSHADVMSRVFEQHPNLSVFHSNSDRSSPSPPPSPSKSTKRNVFKRLSRAPFKEDNESIRAGSPVIGHPKKMKSPFNLGNGNNSQASLSILPTEPYRPSPPTRRSSFDMLRPTNESAPRQNATISVGPTSRRPSLDMLRFNQDHANSNEPSPMTPSADVKFGSVRSILRDPKTPGTGQNVRFFSRDAYRLISPDQSMEVGHQPMVQDQLTAQNDQSESLMNHLNRAKPDTSEMPAVTRASSSPKASRPTVAEVFSPLGSIDTPPATTEQAQRIQSANLLSPLPAPDFNDLFDMSVSEDFNLPTMPPGLGFDVPEPTLDIATDTSMNDGGHGEPGMGSAPAGAVTSTPFRDKGKGKAKEVPMPAREVMPIDETIFHSQEKSPRLPSILHDRSQSFSFGQTIFHSMDVGPSSAKGTPESSFIFSAGDLKASLLDKDDTSSPVRTSKNRARALSDTVFQNMIRSSPKPPEADIIDDSSQDLVVYSDTPEQPDPFRANATTYYTPQTMIPVTPPESLQKHMRKTSKENSFIFSLQTQLALQTDLCSQYEADLHARDELVEILGKRLSDVEEEDARRRSAVRTYRKKVQELEREVRTLEHKLDDSKQDSFDRSLIDEASSAALRTLHKRIEVLEREKGDWVRREDTLREEVATLEGLVKDRSEDVIELKETLWKRDESEKELKDGIRDAKEQMEMMGNVSCGLIDEEELKKLVLEKEMMGELERERHRVAEFGWEEEKGELHIRVQRLEADKTTLEAELENANLKLTARGDEYDVLKAELDAQWGHSEKATEKIEALEAKITDLETERDALRLDTEVHEQMMATTSSELTEMESKKNELENEIQAIWNYKEELEREREQLDEQLQHEQNRSEELNHQVEEQNIRISKIEQEHRFSQENISRLEEKLRRRDQEIDDNAQGVLERESETEHLREEMSKLRREHSHVVNEQSRALEEAAFREGETKVHMENLVRQQATSEMEMKTSEDKIRALKEEVERQRRRIQTLQQDNADNDLKLLNYQKQLQRDRDDLDGLNMALDSKQQELELLKRNLEVKGIGGLTPAPASRLAHHRRDSSVFNTPTVSRPPSVASDTGSTISKDRKRPSIDTPASSATKITAFGKSVRANGVTTTTSATKRVEGSMGPPPLKARPSLATPTPAPRAASLTRSSSAKPATPRPGVSLPHRRVSSDQTQTQMKSKSARQVLSPSPVPSLSEQEEKENIGVRSKVPVPA